MKLDCAKCGFVHPDDDSGEMRCPKCGRPLPDSAYAPEVLRLLTALKVAIASAATREAEQFARELEVRVRTFLEGTK